jgi:hypothetical protein
MILRRSDYDQAARYLQHACDLMDRQAPGKMRATCEVLRLAIRRLSPGDHFVGGRCGRDNRVTPRRGSNASSRCRGRRYLKLSRC